MTLKQVSSPYPLSFCHCQWCIHHPYHSKKEEGCWFWFSLLLHFCCWLSYEGWIVVSASAAACVPGPCVFPDSVVAQCAPDFSHYSDTQLLLIKIDIKKKKKGFCLLWLQRQPQKYEPNIKWCLHESVVTLHNEQKANQSSEKGGEQIVCVLLSSLVCALSPTATSYLFGFFLMDFFPRFNSSLSYAHNYPHYLPHHNLLSFGYKYRYSRSCIKHSLSNLCIRVLENVSVYF